MPLVSQPTRPSFTNPGCSAVSLPTGFRMAVGVWIGDVDMATCSPRSCEPRCPEHGRPQTVGLRRGRRTGPADRLELGRQLLRPEPEEALLVGPDLVEVDVVETGLLVGAD